MRRNRGASVLLALAVAFGSAAAGCEGEETVVEDEGDGETEDEGTEGEGSEGEGSEGEGSEGEGDGTDVDIDVGEG